MNRVRFTTILVIAAMTAGALARGVYLSLPAFLEQAFGAAPEAGVLWLSGEQRQQATAILGHPFQQLRVRYWNRDGRSAWVLEEIGKERPITIGLVVEQEHLQQVRILEFRESRGWEVRYPFFTAQFEGASLTPDLRLDRSIDGITGATLSVRAVTRAARLALWLAQQLPEAQDDGAS